MNDRRAISSESTGGPQFRDNGFDLFNNVRLVQVAAAFSQRQAQRSSCPGTRHIHSGQYMRKCPVSRSTGGAAGGLNPTAIQTQHHIFATDAEKADIQIGGQSIDTIAIQPSIRNSREDNRQQAVAHVPPGCRALLAIPHRQPQGRRHSGCERDALRTGAQVMFLVAARNLVLDRYSAPRVERADSLGAAELVAVSVSRSTPSFGYRWEDVPRFARRRYGTKIRGRQLFTARVISAIG